MGRFVAPPKNAVFQPTRPLRGATSEKSDYSIDNRFQPTRPLRGATAVNRCRRRAYQNFNPRAPCGARHVLCPLLGVRLGISTHAPLAGRDLHRSMTQRPERISTHAPLAGRDVSASFERRSSFSISTHAPLAGRDSGTGRTPTLPRYFNPRAPCGARPAEKKCDGVSDKISTHAPLAGRDRRAWPDKLDVVDISTHAPLAGRDRVRFEYAIDWREFQPTRPLRGATGKMAMPMRLRRDFNPRAPCGARRFRFRPC